MAGAGSTLAEHGDSLDAATRAALARSIETKAREMSELISNVLDLMRFESGQMRLRTDWQTLDELIEPALRRLEEPLARYRVELRLPAELPPVYVDGSLITQVFTNLLDNIVKYTAPGTHIQISAAVENGGMRVTVDDDGPGLPVGDPARLFEKFQRGSGEGTIVGVGLGLAICRAIIRAHGGEIEARARPGGGARIELTLPTVAPP
jgi:two-component system sensor histidine kinase KdpD